MSLYKIKENKSFYDDTSSLKGSEYVYLLKPWSSKDTYLSDVSNQNFLESGKLWAAECAAALSLIKQFTPLFQKTDHYLIIDRDNENVFSMHFSCFKCYFEIRFFPPYRSRNMKCSFIHISWCFSNSRLILGLINENNTIEVLDFLLQDSMSVKSKFTDHEPEKSNENNFQCLLDSIYNWRLLMIMDKNHLDERTCCGNRNSAFSPVKEVSWKIWLKVHVLFDLLEIKTPSADTMPQQRCTKIDTVRHLD